MKRLLFLSPIALAVLLIAAARAHDTWLIPDRFEVAPIFAWLVLAVGGGGLMGLWV